DLSDLEARFASLEDEGRAVLRSEGAESIESRRHLDLRYVGTDAGITIELGNDVEADFVSAHQRRYGYSKDAAIEIMTLRVEVHSASTAAVNLEPPPDAGASEKPLREHSMWNGE